MKVLAFTDSHLGEKVSENLIDKAKRHNVDLVICCGDFVNWGVNTEKVLESFKEFNKPVLVIPGNHEDEEEVEEVCNKFPFLHFINETFLELNGFVFFGYGGGGFNHKDLYFEKLYNSKLEEIKNFKDKKSILVFHGPVYGTKLDYLEEFGYTGSKSTLKLVKELNPSLVLSGHIHQNFGQVDKINNTLLVNPGDKGMVLEVE